MDTDPILMDDSFAPLKRNQACLACKRRKVRCDGTRPSCSPCLRSHAHACRAAQRAGTKLPILACDWAEADDMDSSPEHRLHESPERRVSGPSGSVDGMDEGLGESHSDRGGSGARTTSDTQVSAAGAAMRTGSEGTSGRKKHAKDTGGFGSGASAGAGAVAGSAAGAGASKKAERERERRREEEKEQLLARIADLESKLASLSTDRQVEMEQDYATMSSGATSRMQGQAYTNGNGNGSAQQQFAGNLNNGYIPSFASTTKLQPTALLTSGNEQFDFANMFMIPLHWPRNLPPPYLFEHLIDTFFTHVPSSPRMIHRATLMSRLRLVPSHDDFPHPALLHAICATAGQHTAWVASLPPDQIEARVQEAMSAGENLEDLPDFSLAQVESARRAIHQTSNVCSWGAGRKILDVLQAQVLMAEVYSQRGFTMLAWTLLAVPVRLVQGLELTNRNVVKRFKMGLIEPPADSLEREERLATVWYTYISEAFFAVGSYWEPSMDERTFHCHFPAASGQFNKGSEWIEENPQTPSDADVFRSHPVADPFVLVCKVAILAMRSARWRCSWHQRKIVPGDDLTGMQNPEFQQLVRDIYEFQSSLPVAIKNIFKMLDSGARAFDTNLLAIHIIPQVTLLMLYEPFTDWKQPNSVAIMQMQRAYETVVGVVHLIPSNLDLSLILNTTICYSLYITGRVVADFTAHALERQAFSLAVRYRADLMAIQALLFRYGAKSPMGIFVHGFLETYLSKLTEGVPRDQLVMCPSDIDVHAARKKKAAASRSNEVEIELPYTKPNIHGGSGVDFGGQPGGYARPQHAQFGQGQGGAAIYPMTDSTGVSPSSSGARILTPTSTTGSARSPSDGYTYSGQSAAAGPSGTGGIPGNSSGSGGQAGMPTSDSGFGSGSGSGFGSGSGMESTGMTPFLNLDTPEPVIFGNSNGNGDDSTADRHVNMNSKGGGGMGAGNALGELSFMSEYGLTLESFDPPGFPRTVELMKPLEPLDGRGSGVGVGAGAGAGFGAGGAQGLGGAASGGAAPAGVTSQEQMMLLALLQQEAFANGGSWFPETNAAREGSA